MKFIFPYFILLTVALFPLVVGFFFHTSVPFNSALYSNSFHHFIPDSRATTGRFYLPNALAQADSQWYLKIASTGYPKNPHASSLSDKSDMSSLSYAFFPLYPLVLRIINTGVCNIEITAFITLILLLLSNVISLYRVFGLKTALLVLAFPFSIFLRSYYAESLLLLLLTWFIYFISRQKYFVSSVLISLVSVTKGTLILLLPIFWYLVHKSDLTRTKKITYLTISVSCLVLWSLFCYYQTSNPFYFLFVRRFWEAPSIFPFSTLNIVSQIIYSQILPLHFFHYSIIENLLAVFYTVTLFRIIKSDRTNKLYALLATGIWGILFTRSDLLSFSRFQSLNIPLFIYITSLKGYKYWTIVTISLLFLAFLTPYFLNWYWIG